MSKLSETVLATARQIRSVHRLCETILGTQLDEDLYGLLGIEESRNLLRTLHIETHFAPDVRSRLVEQGSINVEAFRYSQRLLERARMQQVKEDLTDEEGYQPTVRVRSPLHESPAVFHRAGIRRCRPG